MPVLEKRLWRIAHSESSLGWGGQEHRVLAELHGFQQRGSDAALLAPSESLIFQRSAAAGITVQDLRAGKLQFPFSVMRTARWLRQNRIQVLNPHSSRDGWILGIAGRIARVPLIIRTRHIDVSYPNRWMSRHAFVTFCDHVITTSEKIAQYFREFFELPASRVSTIPTGVDLARFSRTGPKACLPGDARVPSVGMISVLRSWKGHKTFLDAIELLRREGFQARCFIVGAGPIQTSLEKQVAEKGLSKCVTFLGHREDVPEVLRALDLLVIPSTRHEGIPQIGLQALACQTAVVGSDVGGIPEIIQPERTGRIFPAENSAALAGMIRKALSDQAATTRLSEAGRALVVDKHSLEAMLVQLDGLYRRYLPL